MPSGHPGVPRIAQWPSQEANVCSEFKTSLREGQDSLLGKGLHPCVAALSIFCRQTFTDTRSVPGRGLRNVGGHRDVQYVVEGVVRLPPLRRGGLCQVRLRDAISCPGHVCNPLCLVSSGRKWGLGWALKQGGVS